MCVCVCVHVHVLCVVPVDVMLCPWVLCMLCSSGLMLLTHPAPACGLGPCDPPCAPSLHAVYSMAPALATLLTLRASLLPVSSISSVQFHGSGTGPHTISGLLPSFPRVRTALMHIVCTALCDRGSEGSEPPNFFFFMVLFPFLFRLYGFVHVLCVCVVRASCLVF